MPAAADAHLHDVRRGLLLGLLGVSIFALSIPMTRLASGSTADPQLPPMFVAFGRAALAGLCALVYLAVTRWRRPATTVVSRAAPGDRLALLLNALGTVIGWPVFLGLAVREVEGAHASVISGVLPLATAAIAAWRLRQRPSHGFWLAAWLGCALVLAFALLRGWQSRGAIHVSWADGLLLLAVLSAAGGYVSGARLTARLGAEEVIGRVLILSLPVTLPLAGWFWPELPASASAWAGFLYVAVFSQWLGFFAWYRALAAGGTVRVSQVQLLQPFLSLLFCVPVLGESLDATMIGFSLAIIATVAWSRRQAVHR